MASIQCSIQIDAEVGRVFEVFTDLEAAPQRIRSILRLELLDDGPLAVGSRFRETRSFFNREATEEMKVTELEPPDRYAVECISHGARYLSTFVFQAAEGGTRVDVTFDVEPRSLPARLLSVFSGLMLKPVRTCTESDLQDLKRFIETPDPS